MPAPSLYDTTKRRLQRSIHLVVDVGDIPFHVVEPVLKKIENPQQLREIEANSPHIADDTGPLWLVFIKRDIQSWEKKPHTPRNPASWCKVYYKLKREQEQEIVEQQAALKAALAKTEQERKKNTSTLLNRTYDPVKHQRRPQINSGPALHRDPRNFTYMPGETKKRLTGRGIMAKIHHQAQGYVSARKSASLMNRPTHLLQGRATELTSAPKSMVVEKNKAPQPVDRGKQAPPRFSAPGRATSAAATSTRREQEETLKEREARLKALTSGQKHPPLSKKAEGLASSTKPVRNESPAPAATLAVRPSKRKAESNCLMAPRKR